MASKKNGTLYVGVTSDLITRAWQHQNGSVDGFTKKYNVKKLVWYEFHSSMPEAIKREKCLKEWQRDWKIRLVNETNPAWNDLYDSLLG